MKKDLIKKFTSRKFIVAAIAAIAGVITMIVGNNAVVQTIAGALTVIVPTVVYCIMEGVIDAKSIKTITDATADAAEQLGADAQTVDTINKIGATAEALVDNDGEADTE